jgi:hypothetical protein
VGAMAGQDEEFRYLAAIAENVIDTQSTDLLGGLTSMHDLIVVSTPIPAPPLDVVVVRAPGRPGPRRPGTCSSSIWLGQAKTNSWSGQAPSRFPCSGGSWSRSSASTRPDQWADCTGSGR